MARRRQISEEEEALWRHVTRSVMPLRRPRKEAATATDRAATKPEPKPTRAPRRPTAVATKPISRPPAPASEPALAPLDRRTRQRLARGTQEIDARLDLHGRTQSEAHTALLRFLHRAQGAGAKTVLVITGKGGVGSGERGVLKRQVPQWLALPEFRGLVVGFSSAAIGHGGEGALYVQVRRGRGRIRE
jgi:DNA-nicking Smr family endonuclease